MFGGETGKQTAKKWWVGTAVAIAVILEQMQSFHGYKQMLNSALFSLGNFS